MSPVIFNGGIFAQVPLVWRSLEFRNFNMILQTTVDGPCGLKALVAVLGFGRVGI